MRKILIRTFAFSYFFKLFGKTINLPRNIIAFVVSMYIGVICGHILTDNLVIRAFSWFPFIITALVSMSYFRIKPIIWQEDKNLMSFTQRYVFLGIQIQRHNNKKYEREYLEHESIFYNKYKKINVKFAAFGSVGLVFFLLAVLAMIFYFTYE